MIQNERTPATTVAKPSEMNIHAQAALPPIPFMLEIAALNERRVGVSVDDGRG